MPVTRSRAERPRLPADGGGGGTFTCAASSPLVVFLEGDGASIFSEEVLINRLKPWDRTLFASASRACRAAVAACGEARKKFPQSGLYECVDQNCALRRRPFKYTLHPFVKSVALLRWARAHGAYWGPEVGEIVALFGGENAKEVLEWAFIEEKLGIDRWVCAAAAGKGDLDVLKWLRTLGAPWDAHTTGFAAAHGHLDVLRWAVDNGCELRGHAFYGEAAEGGHLECMKFGFARMSARRRFEGLDLAKTYAEDEGHDDVIRWIESVEEEEPSESESAESDTSDS